ncbi:MAG: Na(+)/H(+) antiporter subunit B [Halobacteriovoraceae bacterium]|nr:Na(+)/H(+) antiporter subunit B [Halobacteriovoraceae bacterium]|tara:strand:- start:68650 stop:69054 length:405 start_codon:yes stop_codon:yes gene_type:complete
MGTLIIKVASKYLIAIILLYSLFMFFRGHNYPGGGFIGGLAAATAWSMYGIVYKASGIIQERLEPSKISAFGLLVILISGVVGLGSHTFFKGVWFKVGPVKLGTPLLFDAGVYLVVFGAVVNIVSYFEESFKWK